MNYQKTVQEKGPSEGFRSLARNFRKRDEMFHMTRKTIAVAALTEIQNGSASQERLEACFMDIEDGFFQKFIEPEDLGLTWGSWRELCRAHNYKGIAAEVGAGLQILIKNEAAPGEEGGEKREIIMHAEKQLVIGNITLDDMEMTPEDWITLCKKYNYYSKYSFYCAPELFDNPVHFEKHEIDKDHSIELHVRGGVYAHENKHLACHLRVIAYLVKKESGQKHILIQNEIVATKILSEKAEKAAQTEIKNAVIQIAKIVIAARGFQAEVLQ